MYFGGGVDLEKGFWFLASFAFLGAASLIYCAVKVIVWAFVHVRLI